MDQQQKSQIYFKFLDFANNKTLLFTLLLAILTTTATAPTRAITSSPTKETKTTRTTTKTTTRTTTTTTRTSRFYFLTCRKEGLKTILRILKKTVKEGKSF